MATETARRDSLKRSPLKGALLALLLELDEPTHGYKLAPLLAERLEPAEQIEIQAVYRMLKDLEALGLVVGEWRRGEEGGRRPPKRVYRVTEMAEPAVDQWMATSVPDGAARIELLIKIAFSRPSDAPLLLDVLRMRENRCIERIKDCDPGEVTATSTWAGIGGNVALIWTEKHGQAELEWIMSVREWIHDYAVRRDDARR